MKLKLSSRRQTPKPDIAAAVKDVGAVLLSLVNRERLRAGKRPLKLDQALAAGAQRNADWMNARGRLSHAGPFRGWSAENAAWGYPTPEAVVAGWMGSRGHRANILGPYSRVGFGRAGAYWCADFSK